MVNESLGGLVRFGAFELNLRSAELYCDGQKVQLQEQPFQILRLLTETPREVVTREEIRGRLWPDDTIVEFENAINAAIKKLRIALGDSVEEPRYVETVKRRGYRLMVPVERVPLSVQSEPASLGETVPVERYFRRCLRTKTVRGETNALESDRHHGDLDRDCLSGSDLCVFSWDLSNQGAAQRQGQDRSGGVHQQDRRSCIRRDTSPGSARATGTIAVPQPRLR